MNLIQRVISGIRHTAPATFALVAGSASAAIQSRYNLPPPASHLAQDIYELHDFMLIICGAIFILVFGVMFYSIWKHRKSKGAVASNWHENTTVEIVWTVIPFIIIILMALPATRTVVAMKDTSNADLTVKATGYQWQWGYDYIRGEGEGIGFLSRLATPRAQIEGNEAKTGNYLSEVTEPLVVPVNRKIRVITTANDVIHSWGVPALGVKQDAIPGFTRDTWFRAEQIRDVLRPVLRAVRQGPRVHANRRASRLGRGLYEVGSESQTGDGGAGGRSGEGVDAARTRRSRGEGLSGQLSGVSSAYGLGHATGISLSRRQQGRGEHTGAAADSVERPQCNAGLERFIRC